MISSVLGAVIMSAATVSMLIALRITNETFKNIGRQPLSSEEINILSNAGLTSKEHIEIVNNHIREITFEWKILILKKYLN